MPRCRECGGEATVVENPPRYTLPKYTVTCDEHGDRRTNEPADLIE
jgi:hypothetical protein